MVALLWIIPETVRFAGASQGGAGLQAAFTAASLIQSPALSEMVLGLSGFDK